MSNVAPSWLQEIRTYWSELTNQETAAVASASRAAATSTETGGMGGVGFQAGTAQESEEVTSPSSMLLYGKFGN